MLCNVGQVSSGPDSRPTPLHELRVVEISDRIAGSYCGKLLLDAGAQVRKIEPPQGDWLRRYSASCSPVPDGDASPFYQLPQRGQTQHDLRIGRRRFGAIRATCWPPPTL